MISSKSGTVYINKPISKKKKVQKDQTQKNQEDSKLDELVHRAGLVIFEAISRSPTFSRHKDRITICPNRITITKSGLFYRDEYPMPVENVTGARIYTHLASASIMIDTFGIPKPDPVKNLKVNDARLARRYILALIECKKANIDLSGMDLEKLRNKLKNIGMVRHSAQNESHQDI